MTITNAILAEQIESLQAEIEPLLVAASEASWQLNITSEEHWQEESTRLDTALRTVLSRPEPYAFLREAAVTEDVDPQLRRQAALLRDGHAPNQLSAEACITIFFSGNKKHQNTFFIVQKNK